MESQISDIIYLLIAHLGAKLSNSSKNSTHGLARRALSREDIFILKKTNANINEYICIKSLSKYNIK